MQADLRIPCANLQGRPSVSPEEFRRYGHELIDWLADYHAGLADRPVMAKTRPGEVRDALPAARRTSRNISARSSI